MTARTTKSMPIRNSHQPTAAPMAATAQASPVNSGHQLCGLKNPTSPVPSAISAPGLSSGRRGSLRPVNRM